MPKKRTILLMATTMLFAVLVLGGVAYALDFTCNDPQTDPHPGGRCSGTSQDDRIDGTVGDDFIVAGGGMDNVFARGGSDTIHGRNGGDLMVGGGAFADGSDVLYGEGGSDDMVGNEGSNQYFGGSDTDFIRANLSTMASETEVVSAGRGDDFIFADDQAPDDIDCGAGGDQFDVGPGDTTTNCEIPLP
jgi:Ca2+-binding RTX toxin-like protein